MAIGYAGELQIYRSKTMGTLRAVANSKGFSIHRGSTRDTWQLYDPSNLQTLNPQTRHPDFTPEQAIAFLRDQD